MSRPRLFYDIDNPVMLTDTEIDRLTPAEANAACDQIDQNLIRVLSKVDENFAEAYQILTSRILPAVQEYGESSQQIWASVKFWKSFFEASANTKLDSPYQVGDMSYASEGTEKVAGAAEAGDESLKFQEAASDVDTDSTSGTPRAAHTYSADMSPYQALQKDLKALNVDADAATNKSAVDQATRDVARLRLGLPSDSPGMPPLPDFETGGMSLFDVDEHGKGKGRGEEISYGSPRPRQKAGADKFNPDLRQKLLMKQMTSPLSQPSAIKGRLFPADLPKGWNGITDLSQTSMSAFASPAPRGRASSKDDATSLARHTSPPPSLSYDLSHASPFSATPQKEAARRVARNVYDLMGSPLEPPSVLKNWKAKDYDDILGGVPAPSPNEGVRKGFEEEAYIDDDEASIEIAKGSALADFQGGTTAKIDDLLDENSFAGIVDDDDGARHDGDVSEEFSLGEGEVSADGDLSGPIGGDESYPERRLPRNAGAEGPEDTLFGMPQDSFAAQEGSNRFKMMGMDLDNMHTLHGGDLLSSEPFEPSPLAARDRR